MTNSKPSESPRPSQGLDTFAAEELAIERYFKRMDAIVESMWETHDIWQIAVAVQDVVRERVTARQIWGAHQRLLTAAKREAQKD